MKYFLHDSSSFDDEKITELFMNFGYEGLGLFYTILEKIAKQEKPIKTDVLKKQLFVGKKLNKCWNFLESLELISTKNGETFNENLLKFSEKYQVSREKNKERIEKFRTQKTDIKGDEKNVTRYNTITERECNAPKVKISKVKESKVNIIENNSAEIIPPQKIFFGENKKVSLTEIEYQKLIDELDIDLTERCINKLDHYKNSSGKRYKSDYSAMHTWVIEQVKNDLKKEYGKLSTNSSQTSRNSLANEAMQRILTKSQGNY
jgi:hypothetical protein